MYVHDAQFTHNGSEDRPTTFFTPDRVQLVLPKSTSQPEVRRVAELFDRLFRHVRSANTLVRDFVTIAEEMRMCEQLCRCNPPLASDRLALRGAAVRRGPPGANGDADERVCALLYAVCAAQRALSVHDRHMKRKNG